jgi:hypothetical protein
VDEAPRKGWVDPPRSALWRASEKFVAFLSQITPIVPVLPTQPVRKFCTVYTLRFDSLHGMEEFIGSIPIRSTNNWFILNDSRLSPPESVFAPRVLKGAEFFSLPSAASSQQVSSSVPASVGIRQPCTDTPDVRQEHRGGTHRSGEDKPYCCHWGHSGSSGNFVRSTKMRESLWRLFHRAEILTGLTLRADA